MTRTDPTFTTTAVNTTGWIALCPDCARSRREAAAGGWVPLPYGVMSGACSDCGAGFCLCGGRFDCDPCPRKNAPSTAYVLLPYEVSP